MQILLTDAHVVLRDQVIERGWVLIEDEVITGYGQAHSRPQHAAQVYNLAGNYVLPGVIDLHCDAIEKQIQPRPGVMIDESVAFYTTDRILACSGITTELHSLSLDDAEFGVRNEEFVRNFIAQIAAANQRIINHLVHCRVEVSSERGVISLAQVVDSPYIKLISIMDHSPGQGQYPTDESFRYYVAKTTGRNDAEIDAIIQKKHALQASIPQRVEEVIRLAHAHHIPLATHDDDTAVKVHAWVEQGIRISEFPTTMEAAVAAHQHAMLVGMGAPNVLRGKSSGGNLSAIDAVKAGVVDWLCSDYYPAAMIPAAFKLADLNICSLPDAINLITYHPAKALGVEHTIGSIQLGLQADLVVVEKTATSPVVKQAYVRGHPVMQLH